MLLIKLSVTECTQNKHFTCEHYNVTHFPEHFISRVHVRCIFTQNFRDCMNQPDAVTLVISFRFETQITTYFVILQLPRGSNRPRNELVLINVTWTRPQTLGDYLCSHYIMCLTFPVATLVTWDMNPRLSSSNFQNLNSLGDYPDKLRSRYIMCACVVLTLSVATFVTWYMNLRRYIFKFSQLEFALFQIIADFQHFFSRFYNNSSYCLHLIFHGLKNRPSV